MICPLQLVTETPFVSAIGRRILDIVDRFHKMVLDKIHAEAYGNCRD